MIRAVCTICAHSERAGTRTSVMSGREQTHAVERSNPA
jgi:hypothetical protein